MRALPMDDVGETLANQIERLMNLLAAGQIPMSPDLHLMALGEALPEITTELRRIHCTLVGDDPWEGMP